MNSELTATPRRPMPTLWASSLRVFDLSLGEMLWSRRTVFLALIVGGPVVIAFVLRIVDFMHVPAMKVNGIRMGGPSIFGLLLWFLFLRFIVPILGIFYGTSLIADEVEDKTITYLFTRPIPRRAVLLGKYFAYLVCTVLLALGLCVYGGLFAAVGAWIKRPVLVGLFFAFGWENFALALPGYLKHFTVAYYLQGLVPQAMPNDSAVSLVQSIFREIPTLSESLIWMAVMEVGFLWLAARFVTRKEYVLEQ